MSGREIVAKITSRDGETRRYRTVLFDDGTFAVREPCSIKVGDIISPETPLLSTPPPAAETPAPETCPECGGKGCTVSVWPSGTIRPDKCKVSGGTGRTPAPAPADAVERLAYILCEANRFAQGQYLAMARAARDAVLEEAAQVADGFTCGACGMDGKAAAAIRARKGRT